MNILSAAREDDSFKGRRLADFGFDWCWEFAPNLVRLLGSRYLVTGKYFIVDGVFHCIVLLFLSK